MALYQAICKKVLDHAHLVATWAALTTGNKLRLFSTTPSATGGGTELSTSGGYTAGGQAVTMGAATAATPSVSSNGSVSWTNMPAATTAGIDITDSAGTPVAIEFGALTASKTTASGDTLTFSAAAITSSLQ